MTWVLGLAHSPLVRQLVNVQQEELSILLEVVFVHMQTKQVGMLHNFCMYHDFKKQALMKTCKWVFAVSQ